jgi:sugar phosphate isomerase/epimerase
VVDFPAVFHTLNQRGFTGPFAMELEDIKEADYDVSKKLQEVSDSVAYLRSIRVIANGESATKTKSARNESI